MNRKYRKNNPILPILGNGFGSRLTLNIFRSRTFLKVESKFDPIPNVLVKIISIGDHIYLKFDPTHVRLDCPNHQTRVQDFLTKTSGETFYNQNYHHLWTILKSYVLLECNT